MITVSVERTTKASPQMLIDRIWSGVEWKLLRSGIRGLAIEYDDGIHQAVQVCVDQGTRYLAMSIMRFRDSASRISFFYSRLPPSFVTQTGVWEAQAVEGGSRLRLSRTSQLEQGIAESDVSFLAREEAYGVMLKEHLGLVLDAVAHPETGGL